MRGLSYLIEIKSGSGFVISRGAFFKFFSVFLCNLYRYDLIVSTLNSANNGGASFRFFFAFFLCNSCKYNLIVSVFDRGAIMNDIQ